jgi:hypothetical protein
VVEMVVIKLVVRVVMVERHNGERWKRETMVEKEKSRWGS